MGYTVYHNVPEAISQQKVDAVTSDINKICDNFGRDKLDIKQFGSYLEINGVGDDACEPFLWDTRVDVPSGEWLINNPTHMRFTKTWRRPYGDVVLASCMAIKHHIPEAHIPEAHIDSDDTTDPAIVKAQGLGGYNEDSEQVQDAVALYEQTFPDRDVETVLPWTTNYDSQPDAVQSMVASAVSRAGITANQAAKASRGGTKYDARRARILRSQGHTIDHIAQMMGVSASWVSQNTKRAK